VLAVFTAGTLVALAVSSRPVAGQTDHAAATVPDALFADLAHVDRLLAKVIHDVKDGSLVDGAHTIDRIAQIEKAKREMVTAFFDQPVYGLKFSEVFFKLDCLDQYLARARDVIVAARGHVHAQPVIDKITKGQKCKQKLENELRKMAEQQPLPTPGGGGTGTMPAAPLTFGSNNLAAQAQSLVGKFAADVSYWLSKLAASLRAHTAQAPSNYVASATAPADGTITQITLRGYAISGDMPGPGGSEPIRFSVARPQPNGQLQVITTTNPPFTLPGTDGTYTYSMSQVSFPCCKVKKGDVIALDARGGEFAVFASIPGSVTDSFSMAGDTQSAGYLWTGTPHQDVELLMQVTEQPVG
jgi:hypothetical protein